MFTRKVSRRREGGQALIMLTMMVATVLVPITGLAIDGSRAYLVRLKLSSAVDGGALAAGRLIGTGSTVAQQLANAQETAKQFIKANFPANFFGANLAGDPTICVDPGTDSSNPCNIPGGGTTVITYKVKSVVVSASATMRTFFMGVIGTPTSTIAAAGLAQRRDVRVVLVMDRSSSMGGYYTGVGQNPPSIQDMATQFVNSFSGSGDFGGRDQLGLVVFGGSGIVAYPARNIANDYTKYTSFTPPDNNFKVNSNGTIPGYIAKIQSGSNTGTAEALYLAYMTLRADAATNVDLGSQLNVIVLFTDGLPNGITAYANDPSPNPNISPWMMNAGACNNLVNGTKASPPLPPLVSKSNNNMVGWFAQWNGFKVDTNGAMGLFPPMQYYAHPGGSPAYKGNGDDIGAWMSNAGENTIFGANSGTIPQMSTPPAACTTPVSGGMPHFPLHDLYGNYTDVTQIPAVNGMAFPSGSKGQPIYKLGSLYSTSTQCNGSSYDNTKTSNSCQIGLASWQATAHQAWKIWNQVVWDPATETNVVDPGPNMSSPVIFTIGFNHPTKNIEPVDMTLLQIIANDPSSPVPFSNRINGKAYLASDTGAVSAAFQQISSQILRLAH
jgi:Flp pilus assembly protein TadG